jgi:hypothetical protein
MPPRMSVFLLVAVLTGLPSAGPAAERTTLVAVLSGSAAPDGGDPDGAGRAELTVDTGRQRLCYALTTSGIAPASAAHIHRGAATDTGRSVVRLVPPRDGESRACVELTDYDAYEILRRPESFYVNVRNAEYPAGALRGQLQR